jgi:hypothetical protein
VSGTKSGQFVNLPGAWSLYKAVYACFYFDKRNTEEKPGCVPGPKTFVCPPVLVSCERATRGRRRSCKVAAPTIGIRARRSRRPAATAVRFFTSEPHRVSFHYLDGNNHEFRFHTRIQVQKQENKRRGGAAYG